MIKLALANPYILGIAVLSLIGVFGGYSLWIYNKGYDKRTSEYEKAQIEAEQVAQDKIVETKKEARIVYRYIKEQNNDCDIYSNVIDRLPEPSSDAR